MRVSIRTVVTALLSYCLMPMALADNGVQIFTQPPEPQVLADLLFKPQYRSVDDTQTSSPGKFGMMINFDYDSTRIVAKSLPLLDSVGEMLKLEQAEGKALVIEGHADASGPAAYNQNLSERRAEAIKKYLIGSFAIAEEHLIVVGAGEVDPHNESDPYDAINRRVVFKPVRSIVIE